MSTVCWAPASVNTASGPGPGQPSKQTTSRLRTLNRALVQAALTSEALPSDADLAETLAVSERTVRQQALAVYAKSGLAGRAELAAFFLEDLLLPSTPDPPAQP